MADPLRLTDEEIEALVEAGQAALPNKALVAAIVDDLIPAIERIKAATWQAAAIAHAERVVGAVDVGQAVKVLRQIRDDSTTPMNTAADISQVLVEDLGDRES